MEQSLWNKLYKKYSDKLSWYQWLEVGSYHGQIKDKELKRRLDVLEQRKLMVLAKLDINKEMNKKR